MENAEARHQVVEWASTHNFAGGPVKGYLNSYCHCYSQFRVSFLVSGDISAKQC